PRRRPLSVVSEGGHSLNALHRSHWLRPALAMSVVMGVLGLWQTPLAMAERAPAQAALASRSATDDAPEWRELTTRQRDVLRPLVSQWPHMDDTAREKWVNVADRYHRLSPSEQNRVRERMAKWS